MDEKAPVHERVWKVAANRGVSGVYESEVRAWARSELLSRQKNAGKPGVYALTPAEVLVCCNVNLPNRKFLKKIAGDKVKLKIGEKKDEVRIAASQPELVVKDLYEVFAAAAKPRRRNH